MPDRFERRQLAWVPASEFLGPSDAVWFPVGRLRQGVQVRDASAEVQRRAAQEIAADSTLYGGMGAVATRLGDTGTLSSSPALWIVIGSVGALFLLALTNLTNLSLVRAAERSRATAIRIALGAGRRQLGAAIAVEGAMLAGAGALAGAFLATWLQVLFRTVLGGQPAGSPDPTLDLQALAFAAFLGAVSTLIVGMEPLRYVMALDLRGLIQGSGAHGATDAVSHRRARNALLVVQVALTLCFGQVAAVLSVALHTWETYDIGYDGERVVAAFPDYRLVPTSEEEQLALGSSLVARANRLSGVERASFWRTGAQSYPPRPEHDAVFDGGATELEARQARGCTATTTSAPTSSEPSESRSWPDATSAPWMVRGVPRSRSSRSSARSRGGLARIRLDGSLSWARRANG
jgi:hypothetical protein